MNSEISDFTARRLRKTMLFVGALTMMMQKTPVKKDVREERMQ